MIQKRKVGRPVGTEKDDDNALLSIANYQLLMKEKGQRQNLNFRTIVRASNLRPDNHISFESYVKRLKYKWDRDKELFLDKARKNLDSSNIDNKNSKVDMSLLIHRMHAFNRLNQNLVKPSQIKIFSDYLDRINKVYGSHFDRMSALTKKMQPQIDAMEKFSKRFPMNHPFPKL